MVPRLEVAKCLALLVLNLEPKRNKYASSVELIKEYLYTRTQQRACLLADWVTRRPALDWAAAIGLLACRAEA